MTFETKITILIIFQGIFSMKELSENTCYFLCCIPPDLLFSMFIFITKIVQ